MGRQCAAPSMKILLTADLHYRLAWYQWLIDQGPQYDLVCIAGDFLDIFNTEPRMNQAQRASAFLNELAKVTRVAVSSGNHDDTGRLITADRAPVYEWFVSLGDNPKIITDGVTRLVENLVVTTIPYHSSRPEKAIWLDRGRSIRKQRGGQWLVLHHVPSSAGPNDSGEEREAGGIPAAYQPDYFLAGHIHQFPYLGGNAPVKRIDRTTLIVPGQLLSAPYPSHVMLDTQAGLILDRGEITLEGYHASWIAQMEGNERLHIAHRGARRGSPQRAPDQFEDTSLRFALFRSARLRSARLRSAPIRFARSKGCLSRHSFQALTPCLSNDSCN
jgi:hypothetical protein